MSENIVGDILASFLAIAILYGIKCLVDYNRSKKIKITKKIKNKNGYVF